MRHNDQAAIGLAGKGSYCALDLDTARDVDCSHLDANRRGDRLGRAQNAKLAAVSELKSTAARRMLGATSLSTPSHLPPMACSKF